MKLTQEERALLALLQKTFAQQLPKIFRLIANLETKTIAASSQGDHLTPRALLRMIDTTIPQGRLQVSPLRFGIGTIFPVTVYTRCRENIIYRGKGMRIIAELCCRPDEHTAMAKILGMTRGDLASYRHNHHLYTREQWEGRIATLPWHVVFQAQQLYYCLHATFIEIQTIANIFTLGSIPALKILCEECEIPWRVWDSPEEASKPIESILEPDPRPSVHSVISRSCSTIIAPASVEGVIERIQKEPPPVLQHKATHCVELPLPGVEIEDERELRWAHQMFIPAVYCIKRRWTKEQYALWLNITPECVPFLIKRWDLPNPWIWMEEHLALEADTSSPQTQPADQEY